jgi:DNA-binding transcriptional MerR regulator
MKPFYSTRYVAKMIGVSPQTIGNWINAGLIRGPQPIDYGGSVSIRLWSEAQVNQVRKLKGKLKAGRPKTKKSKRKEGKKRVKH